MLRKYVPLLLACFVLGVLSPPASAATPAPGWQATARVFPTYLRPGGTGAIQINVYNVGAQPSVGAAAVTDVLPPGIEFTGPTGRGGECSGITIVTCRLGSVGVGKYVAIGFGIKADAGAAPTSVNHVTVAGGGALAPAASTDQVTVGSTPPPFGFADFQGWFSNADGTLDTQAGSHPYELTFEFDLNTAATPEEESEGRFELTGGEAKNVEIKLPPGFVGDPTAVPQCPREQFDTEKCPASTQIGVDTVAAASGENGHYFGEQGFYIQPLYNLVPSPGLPAQFGFTIFGNQVFLDAGIRSGSDYGVTEHANNLPQNRFVAFNTTTVWGVPADPSHNSQRGRCFSEEGKECVSGAAQRPLLTLPTSCEGPQPFVANVESWQGGKSSQASFLSHDGIGQATGFSGCANLQFGPSISVSPDTAATDTPAGLTVNVKAPQEGLASAEGLSTSDLKDTTVTLPQGVVINPGQAAGLLACQESEAHVHVEDSAAECPNASRVGEDEIQTPLLATALKGGVYVLQSNPPNLRLLVTASGEGVNLKLVGDVHLDEATGQLVTTFAETPELPFSNFRLSFSGGAQAALDTPTQCGTYSTDAHFTPWSSPFVGDLLAGDSFAITSGTNGGPCPAASLPFSPAMIAGATTDQAGGFTDFSLLLQRGDGQQRIEKLQFKAPPGLAAMISKVPLCAEAQAEQNACPAASHIGHAVVTSGPGPYPLVIPQPGEPEAPIYLTGPYKGAPFGLLIVTPVIAGPFDLGTVMTRARIEVDPHTAQITVTTDQLPQIVAGVPTDLRSINAVIDHAGFMFNPTNCSPQSFSGTAFSAQGATAAIGSHFQVGSCQSLKFKPDFKVSTAGKPTRSRGASLTAKILYPTSPLGANQASQQSNIASVKVDLPKQLPSRLTTLQKACTAAQFEANPAGCPVASVVGHAKVLTPILPVPLEGPAYFVSHGGEAFPSLIVVLQGEGVTVDLVGTTFISKAGITSSTFKSTPDVPFSLFELNLPQGKFSALASNLPSSARGSFCGQTLLMPTAFVAQNGAVIHQSTKLSVTGCPKAKRAVTQALKLVAALKACHKQHQQSKRARCERAARGRRASTKTS